MRVSLSVNDWLQDPVETRCAVFHLHPKLLDIVNHVCRERSLTLIAEIRFEKCTGRISKSEFIDSGLRDIFNFFLACQPLHELLTDEILQDIKFVAKTRLNDNYDEVVSKVVVTDRTRKNVTCKSACVQTDENVNRMNSIIANHLSNFRSILSSKIKDS